MKGLSRDMEKRKLNAERIFVWDAISRGQQVCNFLKQIGKKVTAVIDRNEVLHDNQLCGTKIVGFHSIRETLTKKDTIIIGVRTAVYEKEIRQQIKDAGFQGTVWGAWISMTILRFHTIVVKKAEESIK